MVLSRLRHPVAITPTTRGSVETCTFPASGHGDLILLQKHPVIATTISQHALCSRPVMQSHSALSQMGKEVQRRSLARGPRARTWRGRTGHPCCPPRPPGSLPDGRVARGPLSSPPPKLRGAWPGARAAGWERISVLQLLDELLGGDEGPVGGQEGLAVQHQVWRGEPLVSAARRRRGRTGAPAAGVCRP